MEGDLLWRIIIFKIVLCVVVEFVEEELEEGNFRFYYIREIGKKENFLEVGFLFLMMMMVWCRWVFGKVWFFNDWL